MRKVARCCSRSLARALRGTLRGTLRDLARALRNLPRDVIFEKSKGPCGHDNPSFGAFAPNYFAGSHFLRNLKAPAGMATRRSGLLPQIMLLEVIFEKFKGPCGHDTGRSGLLPQSIFAGSHLLRKQQHYFVVFQWRSRKHAQNTGFQ